jgi:hypothetical protein
MHDPVVNELEDYLAGKASPAFHGHLSSCQECRAEVESIAEVSEALAVLGADAETAVRPSPFFYTRVAATIVQHENTGHWGLLAPGAAFFRRVAFASLLLLAGLGSYLVMHEGDIIPTADAVTIIAQHDSTADHAASADRDVMLVTLAGYGE